MFMFVVEAMIYGKSYDGIIKLGIRARKNPEWILQYQQMMEATTEMENLINDEASAGSAEGDAGSGGGAGTQNDAQQGDKDGKPKLAENKTKSKSIEQDGLVARDKITIALTAHDVDMGEVERWLKVVDRTYNAHCKLISLLSNASTSLCSTLHMTVCCIDPRCQRLQPPAMLADRS